MRIFPLVSLFLVAACQSMNLGSSGASARDVHSLADPHAVRVTHASLDLELDFDAREVRGTVELSFERSSSSAPLLLDTQGLTIEAVTDVDGEPRAFALGPEVAHLGRRLTIDLKRDDARVRVRYHTAPSSEAILWLDPEQTAGGKHPFLFTQGQSILTRSWIPLQDSPGVRITYDARIRCPERLTALMSAERLGRDRDGAWRFRLDRPIPAYLIALACGELVFQGISPRCGVWAEPSVIGTAALELEDTERMIVAAEELFGAYRWGRFDVLVLPPSFPYGGMENPTLTFATPTILAGDKSLVSLVAHELAHSWSGNLVTNATWSDFWLNEGFTDYFENRIMEAVYGTERALTERVLAIDALAQEMSELEPFQQILHTPLDGRHPDDGFTSIPYTKGALLLWRLEEVVGRAKWDAFLRGYFDRHAFASITTADFLDDLRRELFDGSREFADRVDLALWTAQPGLPDDAPRPASRSLAIVDEQVAALASGIEPTALDSTGWTTQQWLRFLRALPADVSLESMASLDAAFGFTRSGNSEILCEWLGLAIRRGYSTTDARLEEFLRTVGRGKFLRPLYAALVAVDPARARRLYAGNRARYHAAVTSGLDELVGEE